MSQIITPQMIEQKLRDLSKEVDQSHKDLAEAEQVYFTTKAKYELALAHGRLSFAGKTDVKLTVSDKADMALISALSAYVFKWILLDQLARQCEQVWSYRE